MMILVSRRWRRVEGSDDATARGGKSEILNGEWKVSVVRVEDEETVEDVLLNAFGIVTGRDERTFFAGSIALLDAGVLVEFVAVRLDLVDNNTPLTFGVDCTKWLNVVDRTGAEVSLFN